MLRNREAGRPPHGFWRAFGVILAVYCTLNALAFVITSLTPAALMAPKVFLALTALVSALLSRSHPWMRSVLQISVACMAVSVILGLLHVSPPDGVGILVEQTSVILLDVIVIAGFIRFSTEQTRGRRLLAGLSAILVLSQWVAAGLASLRGVAPGMMQWGEVGVGGEYDVGMERGIAIALFVWEVVLSSIPVSAIMGVLLGAIMVGHTESKYEASVGEEATARRSGN